MQGESPPSLGLCCLTINMRGWDMTMLEGLAGGGSET